LYYIPFLDWIISYNFGKNLPGDIIAGISVGIMLVPQGLAYSFLARVPPIYGLYTAFFPLVVYVIFGNSRQLSIGPEALIAILVENIFLILLILN
jgi:MFS superfamily sulfate permease-like transporter